MSAAQQTLRANAKTQQTLRLIADLRAEWLDEPPAPRPISAVRGSIRVPADGSSVAFESALERDFLLFCRTDPRVLSVHARQLRLTFVDLQTGRTRLYTPDFLVRSRPSPSLRWREGLFEIKRRHDLFRGRRRLRADLAAARQWAAAAPDRLFNVITDNLMCGYPLENARLLSGALDQLRDVDVERACRALLTPGGGARVQTLLNSAKKHGFNPERVLPVVYRMIADGELQIDRGQPITRLSWVSAHASTGP